MTKGVQNIKWQLPVLLLAWAAVFWPVLPPMVETWLGHSDNSHALLVPLISLYFLWEKREAIRLVPVQGSIPGLTLLVASLAIYFVSYAGGIAFFARLMLVAALIGLLWSCLGTAMLRLLAFPLGFLFFMVPIPDTLLGMVAFPLQLAATRISAGLIQFCSIPVYREGNMLYFLQTQLEVAEACSGIRSIMSLTMLGVIFAYISPGSGWRKAVLILSAIPVAMLANILRVSGTGVLAHFFGDRVARGFLHEFSGLAVFMFGLALLFLIYRVLKARDAG
ncbi:MAG TPA: exosortase A [Desulfuromonadales bacterium]|nr:exosortase A [Desulfuromonadales bacterium]